MTKSINTIALLLAALLPFVAAFVPRGMSALLVATALPLAILAGRQLPQLLPSIKDKGTLLIILALGLLAAGISWSASPRAAEMFIDVAYVTIAIYLLFHLSRMWDMATVLRLHTVLLYSLALALVLFTLNVLLDFPLQQAINGPPKDGLPLIKTNVPKRSAALFVLLMWPLALGLYLHGRRKAAYGLLLAVSCLSLLYASTTAMIASFAGLLVLGLTQLRPRIGQSIGLAALPLGFVLMLVLSLSIPNLPRDLSEGIKDTGDYRLMIWNFVGRNTLEHLPMGIGIDGSRVLPSNGETVPYNEGDILPDHPHNIYLQVWLEFGLPGALLAMLLTGLLWRRLYAAPRALQPFIWGYVITAAITLAIAYGAWQAWWLAGHGLSAILFAAIARTAPEDI